MDQNLEYIIKKIKASDSIIITTHRQCDGDGLGAELSMFYALKKLGKRVVIINVDSTPKKYHFLGTEKLILEFEKNPHVVTGADLTLVFDTNDSRLLEPLYSQLKNKSKEILFIDHHPLLEQGPLPTEHSWINTKAASTGELAFQIIKKLEIPLDEKIAQAIYTSITFDTQLYRYIRNSPESHLIAAETLKHKFDSLEVHRHLFGSQTMNKMSLLAKALGDIEYFENGRLAVLKIHDEDMQKFQLDPDDSRDVIDMIMNIETLEAAVIFREDQKKNFKLSLRAKGNMEVLSVAEKIGGGGHPQAAGASYTGDYEFMKKEIIELLRLQLR